MLELMKKFMIIHYNDIEFLEDGGAMEVSREINPCSSKELVELWRKGDHRIADIMGRITAVWMDTTTGTRYAELEDIYGDKINTMIHSMAIDDSIEDPYTLGDAVCLRGVLIADAKGDIYFLSVDGITFIREGFWYDEVMQNPELAEALDFIFDLQEDKGWCDEDSEKEYYRNNLDGTYRSEDNYRMLPVGQYMYEIDPKDCVLTVKQVKDQNPWSNDPEFLKSPAKSVNLVGTWNYSGKKETGPISPEVLLVGDFHDGTGHITLKVPEDLADEEISAIMCFGVKASALFTTDEKHELYLIADAFKIAQKDNIEDLIDYLGGEVVSCTDIHQERMEMENEDLDDSDDEKEIVKNGINLGEKNIRKVVYDIESGTSMIRDIDDIEDLENEDFGDDLPLDHLMELANLYKGGIVSSEEETVCLFQASGEFTITGVAKNGIFVVGTFTDGETEVPVVLSSEDVDPLTIYTKDPLWLEGCFMVARDIIGDNEISLVGFTIEIDYMDEEEDE